MGEYSNGVLPTTLVGKVRRWEYLNVALVLSVLVAVGTFYKFVTAEAKAHAEAVDKKLNSHITEEKMENYIIRQEIRALYMHQRDGSRQLILETPPPPPMLGQDAGR